MTTTLALALTLMAGALAPVPEGDTAARVLPIFAKKCASCHGPNLAKPKGKFGYVLELKKMAGNPKLVVPGKPAESKLWKLVANEDMPPEDSDAGALDAAQKQAIKDWIEAGAPDVKPEPGKEEEVTAQVYEEEPSHPAGVASRTALLLGKSHVLLLHFPIAFAVTAAALEGWFLYRWWRVPMPRPRRLASRAVRFCLWSGVVAALPTVVTGWVLAAHGYGIAEPGVLGYHRWLGTVALLGMAAAALASEVDTTCGVRTTTATALIMGTGLLVTLTAHLGGLLVHGSDFLNW